MGKLGRAGAALAATALLVGTAALPAAAEAARGRLIPIGNDDVKGTVGPRVNLVGLGEPDEVDAYVPKLFDLKLDGGGKLKVYCVEIRVDIDAGQDMVEHPWDSYPNQSSPFHANRGKINWVLHHGFPFKSLKDLNKLDLDFSDDKLSKGEAIAATQAAIWHFSDGVDLKLDDASPDDGDKHDQDIKVLYEYLLTAEDLSEQPTPVLEINPEAAEGEAGKLIGPFTVTTNGDITEITKNLPEGVELTDADGNPVTEAKNITDGTELFLKVPADAKAGEGSFGLTTLSKVDVGRLFVGEDYAKNPAQSLIVAESEEIKAEDAAMGKWTAAPPVVTTTTAPPAETTTTTAPAPTTTAPPAPVPGDNLPDTGANILIPVLVGLGLLGAGAGALIWQRRRKTAA